MTFDMHVHVAALGQHAATDRFIVGAPNAYVRLFLHQLGLGAADLDRPDANDLLRQKFARWVDASSIDRFVLLAMDGVYDRAGQFDRSRTRWMVENQAIANFAAGHPKLLLGASIHPYRRDAVDDLHRWADRGACLVKWIPSAQRIRLEDPLCTPFYDTLAALGLPLLVHTGNEHASSNSLDEWNDPELLRHPLARGVRVIAAHCGTRMFLHEDCRFSAFCRLAREFEHLYGDISAFGIPTRVRPLRRLQRDPRLLAKIVYGSDFPAFPLPRWFVLSVGWSGVKDVLAQSNPLDRPALLMRKLGIPDEVFHRAGQVLRLNGGAA